MIEARSQSPVKVSWFEFLLNPAMLETHLASENTGPSPTELIISFLSNCSNLTSDLMSNGMKSNPPTPSPFGINNLPEECTIEDIDFNGEEKVESKKTQALKLLALKVAAFLKWDVSLLEKKLPITMQQTLLLELLKITGYNIKENGLRLEAGLNSDAEFARVLYFTWILRAVVEGSYPSKCPKFNIQIPGQIDASIVPPVTVDMIMKKLHEETEFAADSLENFLKRPLAVRMPLLNSFSPITDECLNPLHKWEQGSILKEEEIVCQISYSLGRFYFFQELYEKASKHINKTSMLFPKLSWPVFCQVKEAKLKGFYNASAHLLGYEKHDSATPLQDMLQSSVKTGHTDTIKILKNDNTKKEISMALRDTVEMNVLQKYSNKTDLVLNVTFLNLLRRLVAGQVILSEWFSLLKENEEKASLLIFKHLKDVIPSCTQEQKKFVKNFILMLCLVSAPARVLLNKSDIFAMLLTKEEIFELRNQTAQQKKKDPIVLDESFTCDHLVMLGLLERKLLSTTEISTIHWTLGQMREKYEARDPCSLNMRWTLSRQLSVFLKSVPVHVDVQLIQILLAKSNELRMIKQFKDAKPFFLAVEREIKNSSPRMVRYLKWELLCLDLQEVLDSPLHICQSMPPDLIDRIHDFLRCHREREVPPNANLLELCAAVLLNFREWDMILNLGPGYGAFFDLSQTISAVSLEVFLNRGAKNKSRELWDLILPIFSNSNPLKRTNAGMSKDPSRDQMPMIMHKYQFLDFIKKIKDASSLGVIISCLSKFYNILKDDSIGEIFFEYPGLWPQSVSMTSFNMNAVGDAFQSALQHAVNIHPAHTAWLRTKGDVMYVQGHYSAALKYYISAAMVSSDFFHAPFPKAVFDDLMFKHMIHCCTKLYNHTQAAILYQFLDESNYTAAFKALEDRLCNDCCDAYYPFIWDTTLLEFLINFHSRQSEFDYRQYAMQLIGQLELNSNNNEEIQREAANLRKGQFFRSMAKQYL